MRVLFFGDRNWKAIEPVRIVMSVFPKDTVIVEGEAPGADSVAAYVARELGLELDPFPAKWDLYGKKAGPLRNMRMLTAGKPDMAVCFHSNIGESRGTADMLRRLGKAGILTTFYYTEQLNGIMLTNHFRLEREARKNA